MTTADLPDLTPLELAMQASLRAVQDHERVCPGCQHRLHCVIYRDLVKAEQALLDAACRAMQEGQ